MFRNGYTRHRARRLKGPKLGDGFQKRLWPNKKEQSFPKIPTKTMRTLDLTNSQKMLEFLIDVTTYEFVCFVVVLHPSLSLSLFEIDRAMSTPL